MKLNLFNKKLDFSFKFPYSNNAEISKKEIIENLENGILLEDSQQFLNWKISFKDLEVYCEEIEEKGDRVNYYLGEHLILDGLLCHISAMRWITVSRLAPFSQIDFFLGFDSIAINKLKDIENHVTSKLGEPTAKENWSEDEMKVEWKFNKSNITLITWERFAIHGMLHIGLNDNQNRI